MMTRARKTAGESGRSFQRQHSQFASRPFAHRAEEQDAPAGESRVSFSLADIDIFPRETVQPNLPHVAQQKEGAVHQAQMQPTGQVLQATDEVTPNKTGMPDHMKSSLENISGMDLSGVRVHHNSPKPAQLNALAYTQGQEIHLAPGKNRHLPHEAWHAVQQMQGRVKPTMQTNGVSINDDVALEREADTMGAKAIGLKQIRSVINSSMPKGKDRPTLQKVNSSHAPVQRTVLSKVYELKGGGTKRVFYSTYDPGTEFDDHMEAWKYDTKLAKAHRSKFDFRARYPTNFSHYNTPSMNVLGTSNQGPHSLSHSSLAYRLNKRLRNTSPRTLQDQQIPTPKEFKQLVEKEKPKTMKLAQVERMLTDYQLLYERLESLLDSDEKDIGPEVYELMMRLMQMNPYTVYGKGKKTGKRHIKGHGEREKDRFDEAFDLGARFRNKKGLDKFKRTRQKLYSDEEVSSSETEGEPRKKRKTTGDEDIPLSEVSSSEDEGGKRKKGEKTSGEDKPVLTPMQVMEILGRRAPGALYIMNSDDDDAYEQYKRDHPENKYTH
jgi:hypothetical protein